ncbi:MAG: RNA pyrophosphohydrolase [Planctomycetes bacterium]|nr:RNA pyrophosphohydrolase [Planctomycetota bacterium]
MGRKAQFFRAGVGAVVRNDRGEFLVFERAEQRGAWQLPQGGLRRGEEPEVAVLRELEEETGIRAHAVELLDTYPGWLAYELPAQWRSKRLGRGQVHRWFLFRLAASESAIDLHRASAGEFAEWRWIAPARVADATIEFRREVYRQLAARWGG